MINDDVQEIVPNVHQRAVSDYNATKNKNLRAGVQEENIIHEARQKRTPARFL